VRDWELSGSSKSSWHTAGVLKRIGVLTLIMVTSATACSGSQDASTATTGSSESTDSGSASVAAFCVEYASLQGERPESYVGSPEHVAAIEGLLAVAPDSVVADVATFRDYLSSGAIDSDADPESNLTENWPDEVQTAIASTQTFAAENC
jgi:hypothetical protein